MSQDYGRYRNGKGRFKQNELGEVIQNGEEKRKSMDQGREDIIKSLIIIYIYIYKSSVFRHDLKADSESTVLSWSGMLFHKVDTVLSKRRLP